MCVSSGREAVNNVRAACTSPLPFYCFFYSPSRNRNPTISVGTAICLQFRCHFWFRTLLLCLSKVPSAFKSIFSFSKRRNLVTQTPYVVDALTCTFTTFIVVTRSQVGFPCCDFLGQTTGHHGMECTGTVTYQQGGDSFQGDAATSCRFGNSSCIVGELQLA